MKKFRIEHGSVYEFSPEDNAYIFCGKLNGQDKFKWLYEHLYALPPNHMTSDDKLTIKNMID